MRKWLESPMGKSLGIALSCLAAVGLVISLLWMGAVSFVEPTDLLLNTGKQSFFKSATFRSLLRENILQELNFYGETQVLEASGKLNRETLVDILDFVNYGKLTGKNTNGLAYSLGDLLDWQEKRDKADYTTNKGIVVCETPYNGTKYYYIEEFRRQIEEQGLTLAQDSGETMADLQQLLEAWESIYEQAYYGEAVYEVPAWELTDKTGNIVYTSCWLYDGTQLAEEYPPQGASSLLEVVNEKQWSLYDIFPNLELTLEQIADRVKSFETEKQGRTQDSNVQYLYVDLNEKQAFSNKAEFANFKDWKDNLEKFRQMGSYTILTAGMEGSLYDSNMDSTENFWRHWVDSCLTDTILEGSDYAFAVAVDTELPVQDWVYIERDSFQRNVGILKKAIVGCIVSTVFFLVSLIWLTLSAGRSSKKSQIALNFFDLWKTEIAAGLVAVVWGCLLGFLLETRILDPSILGEYLQTFSGDGSVTDVQMRFYIFLAAVFVAAVDLFFLWGYLSLVRRFKAKTLWKNSILRALLRIGKHTILRRGKEAFLALKDIPRKTITLGAFLFVQAFLMLCIGSFSYGGGFWIFCLFATQIAGVGWIVKVMTEYLKIQKGVKKIAGGDIAWQIPTEGLTFDRKALAQDINHIGEGLGKAVEESLKSERLKTELITNVSHDIKTPLTSIINYVDLLKREEFSDEKVRGYLDILEKKSQQLKTLTEDVVEASKASTGNLKLEYEDLNLVEMILQVNGEFQEKFSQQDLDLIQRLPEKPAVIRADGRRVWRILENIYQNVYKYAMPHTRVYVELEAQSLQAVFTMKNISRQPLNISADELTERFIRGDSSRNTQGSGLGLSIAKSLTELQAGEFQLYLDGDLFKVWISFPLKN